MKNTILRSTASIALFLAVLCLLAVCAFHYPEFLSNPQMRKTYDVRQMRLLLLFSLYLSTALSLIALFISPFKVLALIAILLIAVASQLGGASVPLPDSVRQKPIYLSLDLVILDLLFMSLIFVPLERFCHLHKRRFLRDGLSTDLAHYGLNHLMMGGVYYLVATPGNWLHHEVFQDKIPKLMGLLPIWAQVLAMIFIADFFQYWVHRMFHTKNYLWQFHKIHHSTESMDWLASSRLHIVDVILTRSISFAPIVCLGFAERAVQIYLPIISVQALFAHTNVKFMLGPLKYIITTPLVHHWHHSSEKEALDKNFAVTFSCIDVLFGTFYCPYRWPKKYGLYQEKISENFLKQLTYPFIKAGKSILRTNH